MLGEFGTKKKKKKPCPIKSADDWWLVMMLFNILVKQWLLTPEQFQNECSLMVVIILIPYKSLLSCGGSVFLSFHAASTFMDLLLAGKSGFSNLRFNAALTFISAAKCEKNVGMCSQTPRVESFLLGISQQCVFARALQQARMLKPKHLFSPSEAQLTW